MHKRQLLIDEELKQSVDCIKANAATGAGHTLERLVRCCLPIQKPGGLMGWHMAATEFSLLDDGELDSYDIRDRSVDKQESECVKINF